MKRNDDNGRTSEISSKLSGGELSKLRGRKRDDRKRR